MDFPSRLEPVTRPRVRFFGEVTGFVINYSPHHAVRFDMAGEAVEVLERAYRCGTVEVTLGSRKLSKRTMHLHV